MNQDQFFPHESIKIGTRKSQVCTIYVHIEHILSMSVYDIITTYISCTYLLLITFTCFT